MKQYPTYKESGLVNIETIPSHWEALKLRLVCDQIFTGNTPVYAYEPNEFLVFGQRNNQKNCIDFTGIKYADPEFFAARTENEFLRYGDVLLNTLGGGSVGRVGFYDVKDKQVITDGHVMILRGNKSVEQKYLYYFLHSQQPFLEEAAVGSTNQAFLTTTQMFQWKVAVPSLVEQQAIAQFLDSKTAKIDETISLYEQQKADLVEYRKALISDTVTRGLNPNVPLKDSGIQWLGQIPETWQVNRLKLLFTLHRGYDLANEEFVDGGIPVYGSSGLMGYHNEVKATAPNVVIGRSGSVGKLHYVEEDFWAHNTGIYISDTKGNVVKYLYYLLSAIDIAALSTQTAVPTLDRKKVQDTMFPFTTDAEEQQAIVSFLDSKTSMIDEAIRRIDEQIADLKAYRAALITDAVTGKIDVR